MDYDSYLQREHDRYYADNPEKPCVCGHGLEDHDPEADGGYCWVCGKKCDGYRAETAGANERDYAMNEDD